MELYGGIFLRYIALLLSLLFAFCPLCAAKCACSSGGGASYNYLGDPAFDINMDSYEEFARENLAAPLPQADDLALPLPTEPQVLGPQAGYSVRALGNSQDFGQGLGQGLSQGLGESLGESLGRVSLDLDNGKHFDLSLSQAKAKVSGAGNLTAANETGIELVEAQGNVTQDSLSLDVISSEGDRYKIDLVKVQTSLSGRYIEVDPEGQETSGNVRGRTEP